MAISDITLSLSFSTFFFFFSLYLEFRIRYDFNRQEIVDLFREQRDE